MTLIVGWILSIVCTLTYLWDPIVTSWCIKAVLTLCLGTSFVCYVKIFFILPHNQIQVLDHFPQRQENQPHSVQHGAIQKGSVCYIVGADDIGCFLPAVAYNRSFDTSARNATVGLPCKGIYRHFSCFKLLFKPVIVLLED